MDPVQIGEHSPFYAMVVGAIQSNAREIIIAVSSGIISSAIIAAVGYLTVIGRMEAQQRFDHESIEALANAERDHSNDITQNTLQILRQAGTDQLTAQELKQIRKSVDGISAKLEKIYDGQFRNNRWKVGP